MFSQFLSSVSSSFYCISLSLPQFYLFQGLFEAIVSGIAPLISFLVCFSLVHRKDNNFQSLILYSATLLNVFIRSRIFLESLGSFIYKIILSANKDTLTYFFSICVPFLSSYWHKTPSTILNGEGLDILILFLILVEIF